MLKKLTEIRYERNDLDFSRNKFRLRGDTLQMGGEERIVLSGIKKWYSPEQLIGKTVVVAANLAPKTICGIESHGMILCASDASDENLSALTTMGDMASGLKVR